MCLAVCLCQTNDSLNILSSLATTDKHRWGATGSDQAQSRWEDLRQDEERPGAPRPAACMLHPSVTVQIIISDILCLFSCPRLSQAYDQHLNMILGDVEETVTTVEIDEETYEELYKVGFISLFLLTDVIFGLGTLSGTPFETRLTFFRTMKPLFSISEQTFLLNWLIKAFFRGW